jgi:SAM-dependent methyltransferase
VYEATVAKLVDGHEIFPQNPALANSLIARCSRVVAVDPSANVHRNTFAHERVQSMIESYSDTNVFDLATLRMVVEHVTQPVEVARALRRLVRPGGLVVVFTVNLWSPITVVSRVTPFWLHHPVKKVLWGSEEEDTFPVQYLMNTRSTLRSLFEQQGFSELAFAYLDDLTTFGSRRTLNFMELTLLRLLRSVNVRYPENCLLGIYRNGAATHVATT